MCAFFPEVKREGHGVGEGSAVLPDADASAIPRLQKRAACAVCKAPSISSNMHIDHKARI